MITKEVKVIYQINNSPMVRLGNTLPGQTTKASRASNHSASLKNFMAALHRRRHGSFTNRRSLIRRQVSMSVQLCPDGKALVAQ